MGPSNNYGLLILAWATNAPRFTNIGPDIVWKKEGGAVGTFRSAIDSENKVQSFVLSGIYKFFLYFYDVARN